MMPSCMKKIFSCIIYDHEHCSDHILYSLLYQSFYKQVHIITDELARALDSIEDTIQIDNNVSDSLNSLNGSKQNNWIWMFT